MVRDRDAAADPVQESYARVLAVRNAGQEIPEPRALLHQTARRLIIDRHQREAIRQHDDLDGLPESEQPAAPAHLEPESVYAHEQHALAFVAVIDALPPRCREAFVLNRFEGTVAPGSGRANGYFKEHGGAAYYPRGTGLQGLRGTPGRARHLAAGGEAGKAGMNHA